MILGPLQSLELLLAGAVATNELPWTAFINERDDATYVITVEDAEHGLTTGTTAVTAVAAPAAGNHRTVRLTVANRDTAAVTLIVRLDDNGTPAEMFRVVLAVGDTLNYRDIADWDVRDANGSFKTAGSGSGGTPTAITVADTTDTTCFVALFESATGDLGPKTDAGITYNASTGTLTATAFAGPLTGNVTGDVSGNAGTVTVADAGGDTTTWVLLGTAQTGSLAPATDAGLTYNATTNALTATTFIGALTGNASTATALATGRTIGGVSFDGTANIVPTTITVADTTDSTCFVGLWESATGDLLPKTDAGITYNASTGALTTVDLNATGNVVIDGNLTVSGTTVTMDTATLTVEDPLIKLAKSNNVTDVVDVGFYGLYDTSGSLDLYAGLFRDATDGKWRLFKDLQNEPTTTVNTAGTGYAVATLVANVEGALTGNASTATALATPRNINGVAFDGTGNITVTAAGSTLSDTVTVAKGGTSLTTLTANNVILGNGASAPTFVAPGTSGNVLTSNGTTWTSAAATGGSSSPQGVCDFRLGLEQDVISTTDQTSKSTIYVNGVGKGNKIGLTDGSTWTMYEIKPFAMAGMTGLTSAANYDLFAAYSTPTHSSTNTGTDIVTWTANPGWTTGTYVIVSSTGGGLTAGTAYWYNRASSTTGSFHTTLAAAIAGTSKVDLTANITQTLTGIFADLGPRWNLGTGGSDTVRGTGAGGTALAELKGVNTNSVSATGCIGGGTIAANAGLYIGTIRTTSTSTTEMSFSGTPKMYVWSAYNQVDFTAKRTESTATWAWDTASWHSANANSANKVEIVRGLDYEQITAFVACGIYNVEAIGIGIDSTTTLATNCLTPGNIHASQNPAVAEYKGRPGIGYRTVNWIEYSPAGGSTFYGTTATNVVSGLLVTVKA